MKRPKKKRLIQKGLVRSRTCIDVEQRRGKAHNFATSKAPTKSALRTLEETATIAINHGHNYEGFATKDSVAIRAWPATPNTTHQRLFGDLVKKLFNVWEALLKIGEAAAICAPAISRDPSAPIAII